MMLKFQHFLLWWFFVLCMLVSSWITYRAVTLDTHLSTVECKKMADWLFSKTKSEFYNYQDNCSTDKMLLLDIWFKWIAISLLMIMLIFILKPDFSSLNNFWNSIVWISKWRLVLFTWIMVMMLIIFSQYYMTIEQQSWYLHRTGDSIWIWIGWVRIFWILVLVWYLLYLSTWEKYVPWYPILSFAQTKNIRRYLLEIIYKIIVMWITYLFLGYGSVFWMFIILCVRSSHNIQWQAKNTQ